MRKEYVVTEIAASPDGGPYVLVSLADPRELREGGQPRLGPQMVRAQSMEDLFKGLNRAFTSLSKQLGGGFSTVIRLDMREYEESGIRVGDRVYLTVEKAEREGV